MMASSKGSVFGGILLVAGSCIGSAMLGLPVLTGLAGFAPSVAMFVICWLFMVLCKMMAPHNYMDL